MIQEEDALLKEASPEEKRVAKRLNQALDLWLALAGTAPEKVEAFKKMIADAKRTLANRN
jgi:hypothetical protein